ncbi:MAG: hypothetical protein MJE63_34380 [Proteobacteria bacterium]|nr:hypothetical protein [Pseudomonadota bacterium]
MLKSVFFKEYLKIRWLFFTLAALNLVLMIYIFIDTRQLFIMDHAEMVWYRVLHLGQIHYDDLKYAPIATGIVLAFIQYLPEMMGERLRLSLHLPVSPHRLIMVHVLVGLAAIGLIIALDLVALALLTYRFFPVEVVWISFLTALPWCMAGVAAYLGLTFGLLEPGFLPKLFNIAIAAGLANLFLYPAEPGGYVYILLALFLLVLFMIPAVLLPAYRYRYRRVT